MSFGADLRTLQPYAPHIKILGDVYFERVDPMFKVLHRPTAAAVVAAAAGRSAVGETGRGRGDEALLFAIYFAAVTSLGDQECGQLFQQDRVKLVTQYKSGVESALIQADLLNTSDLTTLQAFLIYLVSLLLFSLTIGIVFGQADSFARQLCLRSHNDSRSTWTLLGLAVRIGQALELHSDSPSFSATPFEMEIRRRVWWQIIVLDGMHSEDRATGMILHPDMYDSKMPTIINDDLLHPETITVTESTATEMIFCHMCKSISLPP